MYRLAPEEPRGAASPGGARASTGAPPAERLVSLDAYRGFVMLAMVSGGLGIPAAAKAFPESPAWKTAAFHFEHLPWSGCSFWDLIQPSFMFMVGTALAFSGAKRAAQGQSFGMMLFHAVWRAIVLILLGIFLRSNGASQTNFYLVDVVTQIGLGYVALFLLWRAGVGAQWATAIVILLAYWAWFATAPLPPEGFDYAKVGTPADWREHMSGLEAHWNYNTHPAATFERWLMNQFPRAEEFTNPGGGYCTLNFIPSLATMIFGLIAGEWLRGERSKGRKLLGLLIAGGAAIALGYGIHAAGLCPVVKRIWTPSWAIYAGGWTCLILAGFFFVFDILPLRWAAKPLAVVGANSIAVYVLSWLFKGWAIQTIATHTGGPFVAWAKSLPVWAEATRMSWIDHPPQNAFQFWGPYFTPMASAISVTLVLWAIAWWMDSKKLYIRV